MKHFLLINPLSLGIIVFLCITPILMGSTETSEQKEQTESVAESSISSDASPPKEINLVPIAPVAPLETNHQLNLNKEISVDLIDLEALRKATEQRRGPNAIQRMSLKECIELALKQNPDITVSGLEPLKAQADQLTARGMFDPIWQTQAQYNFASAIASQEIRAYAGVNSLETHKTNISTSVAGKLKLGTQYAITLNTNIDESTFSQFVEEYSGQLMLTLTQPLLRGFGIKVNTAKIKMAENAEKIAYAQLRLTIMNTIAEVMKAYWDLVGAMENVKVREEALANAERLLTISEKRREIGTAADLEVLQAKAGVATRQSELIAARAQLESASDMLKNILQIRDGDLFSKILIVPTDRPRSFENEKLDIDKLGPDVDVAVQNALKNRPEIVMADLQIDTAELQLMEKRNEILPQLDITGSYGQGGRELSWSKMFYGIRDEQEQYYTYGVKATIPIGNRAGRGAYQRAKLTKKEMEERKRKVEQAIMMGVHIAARNVETNRVLVESNYQARKLQEANVIAEEKRLKLGVSTSWRVLQVQTDYTMAKTMEVQAQVAYEKALIDFYLAEGTLLDQFDIQIDLPDVEPPPTYWESIKPRWE